MKPSDSQPYQITEAQVVSQYSRRSTERRRSLWRRSQFQRDPLHSFQPQVEDHHPHLDRLDRRRLPLFLERPLYESRAKLLVHYVLEGNDRDGLPNQVTSGRDMESALNNEMELITSWDLAKGVVDSGEVDLEKLLPDAETPISTIAASAAVQGGLEVELKKNSHVIWISYQHPDPEVPVPVLDALVEKYYDKHLTTYRPEATNFLVEGDRQKQGQIDSLSGGCIAQHFAEHRFDRGCKAHAAFETGEGFGGVGRRQGRTRDAGAPD